MAALRSLVPEGVVNRGYTNGKPYLITLVQDEGERSRQISYLLPNGDRRRVTIDVSHDTDELRHQMGLALLQGRTGIGRKGRK